MKKFISLLLVAGMLVCTLCGCGGNVKDGKDAESKTKVESQTESADEQTLSVQSETKSQLQVQVDPVTPEPEKPEPVYYHAAIKGAVIVEQDGSSSYYYMRKCDSCGYTESNCKVGAHSTYGEMHSGFTCYKCHTHQEIVIKTTQTN